jgi:hypothetical protein
MFIAHRCLFVHFGQKGGRFKAEYSRDLDELQGLHLALAGFDLPDEGIRAPELRSQLPLGKIGGVSSVDNHSD